MAGFTVVPAAFLAAIARKGRTPAHQNVHNYTEGPVREKTEKLKISIIIELQSLNGLIVLLEQRLDAALKWPKKALL